MKYFLKGGKGEEREGKERKGKGKLGEGRVVFICYCCDLNVKCPTRACVLITWSPAVACALEGYGSFGLRVWLMALGH